MSLRVSEIFNSILGEGSDIGKLACFVRFYGCNLNCRYCDTDYAKNSENFEVLDVWKLISKIYAMWGVRDRRVVCLTGGEPMFQEDRDSLILLMNLLKGTCDEVILETNGSYNLDAVPKEIKKYVDYKLNDSGMTSMMVESGVFRNKDIWHVGDCVKLVVSSKEDLLQLVSLVCVFKDLMSWGVDVVVQPVWSSELTVQRYLELLQFLADFVKDDSRLSMIRVLPQLHKLLWGNERGK